MRRTAATATAEVVDELTNASANGKATAGATLSRQRPPALGGLCQSEGSDSGRHIAIVASSTAPGGGMKGPAVTTAGWVATGSRSRSYRRKGEGVLATPQPCGGW